MEIVVNSLWVLGGLVSLVVWIFLRSSKYNRKTSFKRYLTEHRPPVIGAVFYGTLFNFLWAVGGLNLGLSSIVWVLLLVPQIISVAAGGSFVTPDLPTIEAFQDSSMNFAALMIVPLIWEILNKLYMEDSKKHGKAEA